MSPPAGSWPRAHIDSIFQAFIKKDAAALRATHSENWLGYLDNSGRMLKSINDYMDWNQVDPSFPGPERFKGAIRIVMKNGAIYEAVEEHNRGSAANPMTRTELLGKFETNAEDVLTQQERARLIEAVSNLESSPDSGALVQLSIAGASRDAG